MNDWNKDVVNNRSGFYVPDSHLLYKHDWVPSSCYLPESTSALGPQPDPTNRQTMQNRESLSQTLLLLTCVFSEAVSTKQQIILIE